MTRAVPQAAIDLVKSQEGFRAIGYADVGGVPTDGWGNTHGAVVGQPAVNPDVQLAANLQSAADELAAVIKPDIVSMFTDNQWSALIDFGFNEGIAHAGPLWAVLNAQQFDQVPMHLVLYVYAGHPPIKLADLVRRRNAEIELWGTGEPGSDTANGAAPVQLSSAVTRSIATPGAPTNPAPRGIAVIASTAIATTAAAIPQAQGALQAVSDAVTPYRDSAAIIGHVLSLVGVAGAGLAVAALVFKYLHDKQAKSWSSSTAPALHPAIITAKASTMTDTTAGQAMPVTNIAPAAPAVIAPAKPFDLLADIESTAKSLAQKLGADVTDFETAIDLRARLATLGAFLKKVEAGLA